MGEYEARTVRSERRRTERRKIPWGGVVVVDMFFFVGACLCVRVCVRLYLYILCLCDYVCVIIIKSSIV